MVTSPRDQYATRSPIFVRLPSTTGQARSEINGRTTLSEYLIDYHSLFYVPSICCTWDPFSLDHILHSLIDLYTSIRLHTRKTPGSLFLFFLYTLGTGGGRLSSVLLVSDDFREEESFEDLGKRTKRPAIPGIRSRLARLDRLVQEASLVWFRHGAD